MRMVFLLVALYSLSSSARETTRDITHGPYFNNTARPFGLRMIGSSFYSGVSSRSDIFFPVASIRADFPLTEENSFIFYPVSSIQADFPLTEENSFAEAHRVFLKAITLDLRAVGAVKSPRPIPRVPLSVLNVLEKTDLVSRIVSFLDVPKPWAGAFPVTPGDIVEHVLKQLITLGVYGQLPYFEGTYLHFLGAPRLAFYHEIVQGFYGTEEADHGKRKRLVGGDYVLLEKRRAQFRVLFIDAAARKSYP